MHEYFDVDDIPEPIVAVVNFLKVDFLKVGHSLQKDVGQMLLYSA